jgi:gas vesicle protein
MNTKSKVVLGILGAAAAGVVIGLLIAPEKGTDMRKKLKKTTSDWADTLTNLFVKGKEAADDAADEVHTKARQARSTAEDKVNRMKESLG